MLVQDFWGGKLAGAVSATSGPLPTPVRILSLPAPCNLSYICTPLPASRLEPRQASPFKAQPNSHQHRTTARAERDAKGGGARARTRARGAWPRTILQHVRPLRTVQRTRKPTRLPRHLAGALAGRYPPFTLDRRRRETFPGGCQRGKGGIPLGQRGSMYVIRCGMWPPPRWLTAVPQTTKARLSDGGPSSDVDNSSTLSLGHLG